MIKMGVYGSSGRKIDAFSTLGESVSVRRKCGQSSAAMSE
jgi:hypothetical protein